MFLSVKKIENTVNVNGVDIHYHEYPFDGETILFLHFGFSSLSIWNGVLSVFYGSYRLVVPDYRGHGKSEKPQIGYHIDTMADDMIELMNKLNIDKAHFVGSSLGAELAVSIAARYPERVMNLVVEGSAMNNYYGEYGLEDKSESNIVEEINKIVDELSSPPEIYETQTQAISSAKQRFQKNGFWNNNIQTMVEYEVYPTDEGKFMTTIPNWVKIGYIKENFGKTNFEHYYRKIKSPVLFLPGEKSWENVRMQKALSYFSSLLSRSEITHVPGSMHAYVWLLKPIEVGNVVLKFLKSM